ncbi:membrane protein [Pseudomonas brassicacearum]|uniref:fatty acid desaturase family protein n=1 Tax=Pseudomonas brassicacearum TaxID=930166 RepID=UPI00042EB69B|nr:fatty acid desaturase [Pseudomonas brassicacearum]AHL34069.1 membrane protein [Pseudomonas brassicacearum]
MHKHAVALPSSSSNLPSYLFLALCVLNTAAIAWLAAREAFGWLAAVPLMVVQALLMIGVQEIKHQGVHRQFLVGTRLNDAVGVLAAAIFAANFVGYRYFHLEHHRKTCQIDDPEGLMYQQTWPTRLICLLGAAEQLWVSISTNRISRHYLPSHAVWRWRWNNALIVVFVAALVFGIHEAPRQVICAYVLPYCLFSWLDFWLTQAEHYGVSISTEGPRRAPAEITTDVYLPSVVSWLVLHRSLHRTHHHAPATRWFHALSQSRALTRNKPGGVTDLPTFVTTWMQLGPRLWK